MAKSKKHRLLKRYHTPGTPPGTLTRVTTQSASPPRCRILQLTPSGLLESGDSACTAPLEWEGILWLDIAGLPSHPDLERLRDDLGLHPLALEDVVTGGQRPKLDQHGEILFLVLNRPFKEEDELRVEQVSLFLGERFVVSIHDTGMDLFEPIRRRLAATAEGFTESDGGRLFHALADLVVDQGFPVLDEFGDLAEELETLLLEQPGRAIQGRIHRLRRALMQLRRSLWPMREALSRLMRPGLPQAVEVFLPYWKDVYDHALYQLEMVESYRDMSAGMLELHLSSASHRLNDIMRVLTIISTIFIPLTFVTGVYGMNFVVDTDSPWAMPLIHWRYGYPAVLVFMTLVVVGMLWAFRRKGWI